MFIAPLLLTLSAVYAVEYAEILPVEALLEEADDAIRGSVLTARSEWGEDGLIYTRVTMSAEDRLADGYRPGSVSFLVPGGQVDDVVLTIPGAPTFEVGDQYVVFLEGERLLGLGQGVFEVEDDVARRAWQSVHATVPLKHVFGSPKDARSCSAEGLLSAFEEGWSLRQNTMLRLGDGDGRALEVTLIEGLEYSVSYCGDGISKGVGMELVDENDHLIAFTRDAGTQNGFRFSVPRTGSYWIIAHNSGLTEGWTSAVDISVRYR